MIGFLGEIKYLLNNSMYNEIKDLVNNDIETNIVFENEIVKIINKDFIEINIKKECNLNEYLYSISTSEQKKLDLFIPKKLFYRDENYNLKKQKIFIIKNNDLKYFININGNNLIISQNQILESNIREFVLSIDLEKKDYKIIKYGNDLNYSINDVKYYSRNEKNLKDFNLEKKEAFLIADDLLTNLNKIKNIDDILNIEYLYMILNIVKTEHYNSVIEDDSITLSWPYKKGDINRKKDVNLEIILKETKEIIGEICFNYNLDGFSYEGNVGYFVNEQYRGNHYATKALVLLKKLLKNNTFEGDKDLYLSTVLDNVKSQSVIKNNGGELIYEGSVPPDYSLYYIDGVKAVKVYKIKIENKKS